MNRIQLAFVLFGFVLAISGCKQASENYLGDDIRLFKGPVWDLAQAVEKDDTLKIRQILAEHKTMVNFQEPKFGETLLEWAVRNDHYNSSRTLLEKGADPNLQDSYDGYSAFTYAATKFETSDYVKLLLKYHGNPNAVAKNDNCMYCTPLIAAAYYRLESVKLLVDDGADINFATRTNSCALATAFTFKKVDIVKYLLIDKGADFNKLKGKTNSGETMTIANLLREWVFPLNSEKYKMKMEIVKYLSARGVDYWKTPIPEYYYKNYSKDFLDKY